MRVLIRKLPLLAAALLALSALAALAQDATSASDSWSFITAGDMRNFTGPASGGKRYFDGVCQAVKLVGAGAFMLSPGDCDPPGPIRADIDEYLGSNYVWYPVIGNHDADSAKDMEWMRRWAQSGITHLVRRGPPGAELTSFSFDWANAHFVVVDEYYDGHSDAVGNGDVCDTALAWLDQDLSETHQPLIWVTGHKPIKSFPDMDSGRVRHDGDSISANAAHRERFVQILKQHHACAYICGHTHNTSIEQIEGLWQLDSGHARGAGDTGSPSTFLKVRINRTKAWVDVYRSDPKGVDYRLEKTQALN
jgi:predicted phosphodiesterase